MNPRRRRTHERSQRIDCSNRCKLVDVIKSARRNTAARAERSDQPQLCIVGPASQPRIAAGAHQVHERVWRWAGVKSCQPELAAGIGCLSLREERSGRRSIRAYSHGIQLNRRPGDGLLASINDFRQGSYRRRASTSPAPNATQHSKPKDSGLIVVLLILPRMSKGYHSPSN